MNFSKRVILSQNVLKCKINFNFFYYNVWCSDILQERKEAYDSITFDCKYKFYVYLIWQKKIYFDLPI